jgi:large subunit ribosomal protein L25
MMQMETMSRAPKQTKKEGFIPAVFYGSKTKSTPIFINAIEFGKVLAKAGESTTINLVTEKGNETALIQEIARHPVKNVPIHVDFYVIEKGQKVHVKVPITFVGESQAIKEGNVLVKVLYELSVEAEGDSLPHDIAVDISSLVNKDSVIHVKDITLPKGVELYHMSEDEVIVSIAEAKEEVIEEVVAPDLSAIEVEQKGKKDEEGGEAETKEVKEEKPE